MRTVPLQVLFFTVVPFLAHCGNNSVVDLKNHANDLLSHDIYSSSRLRRSRRSVEKSHRTSLHPDFSSSSLSVAQKKTHKDRKKLANDLVHKNENSKNNKYHKEPSSKVQLVNLPIRSLTENPKELSIISRISEHKNSKDTAKKNRLLFRQSDELDDTTVDDEDLPTEDEDTTENEDSSTEDEETTTEDEETTTEDEESSTEDEETTTEDEETTTEDEDTTTEDEDPSSTPDPYLMKAVHLYMQNICQYCGRLEKESSLGPLVSSVSMPPLADETDDSSEGSTGDSTETSEDSTGDSTDDSTGDSTDDSTGDSTDDSTDDSTENSTEDSTEEST